jgi:hypothetical protein
MPRDEAVKEAVLGVFVALNKVARKHFPASGKIGYFTFTRLGDGDKLIVGGGTEAGKQPFKPGIWRVVDDWPGNNPPVDISTRIENADKLQELLEQSGLLRIVEG